MRWFGGVCYARFLPSLGCLGSLDSAGSRGLRLDGDPEDYLWKAFRIGQLRTVSETSQPTCCWPKKEQPVS